MCSGFFIFRRNNFLMKIVTLLTGILVFGVASCFAQQATVKRLTAPLAGTVILSEVEDKYNAQIFNLEMPDPDAAEEQRKLQAIKEKVAQRFPRQQMTAKNKTTTMKKLAFSVIALTALTLISFAPPAELPIGADMPKSDVKMKDISGKEVSLKDAMGEKGLLVMFSCNTCPYVIKNQTRTKEIAQYASEKKLGVIIINSNEAQRDDEDSYEAMKSYAKNQGYKWSYVVDNNSQIADAFGANRTPETFLFNKEAKLVYHGAIDDNPSDASSVGRKHLKEAIDEYVGGKEVSVKTSKSVGCTIKRA